MKNELLSVRLAGIFAIGFLLAACGCSQGPAVGTVHGTVTLDGKPLEEGSVRLAAIDGHAPTAGGQVVKGKFETTAAVAKYRVEIESNVLMRNGQKVDRTKKVDKFADTPGEMVVKLVPDKYNKNSTLELDVKAGMNEPVYDLQSK
jgi:hypothetical protein